MRWREGNALFTSWALSEWVAGDSERKGELATLWGESPPPHNVMLRILGHRRRAIKKGAEYRDVSPQDWLRLCQRYGNRCAYCGREGELTTDHVVPLHRGGRQSIGNLLPACDRCNSRKKSMFLTEWRKNDLLRKWAPLLTTRRESSKVHPEDQSIEQGAQVEELSNQA